MVSIRASVVALYKENKNLTAPDLVKLFPKANIKTLRNALSMAKTFVQNEDKPQIKVISEENVEAVVLEMFNSNRTAQNVRLMMDFLKVKQQAGGLNNDLDVDKYFKNVEKLYEESCQV